MQITEKSTSSLPLSQYNLQYISSDCSLQFWLQLEKKLWNTMCNKAVLSDKYHCRVFTMTGTILSGNKANNISHSEPTDAASYLTLVLKTRAGRWAVLRFVFVFSSKISSVAATVWFSDSMVNKVILAKR